MKLNNPFTTVGYVAPEYFCDRESETKQLIEAINSNRNITLISVRRMGKTGLIKHVGHQLKSRKGIEIIYLDLLPTQNSSEMINILGSALINIRRNENFFTKILSGLSNLRPIITYDTLTGQPVISLDIKTEGEIRTSLQQLFGLIGKLDKKLVIIFDEFQQIASYEEKNLEALLRSIIQEFPAITFIFSGSNKHMLEVMFTEASRPFFGSAELMYLQPIEKNSYKSFIQSHFLASGREVSDSLIEDILEWCRVHTFYVQYFCNRLFANESKIIDVSTINRVKLDILNSFEPSYFAFRKLLTSGQYALLQAIACENGVSKPQSGTFIGKYGLKSASTVKTSLDALAAREMIVYIDEKWQVYDVFLMRWLSYTSNS